MNEPLDTTATATAAHVAPASTYGARWCLVSLQNLGLKCENIVKMGEEVYKEFVFIILFGFC